MNRTSARKMRSVSKAPASGPTASLPVTHFYQTLGTELSTLLAAIIGELDSALSQEDPAQSKKGAQIALAAAETALGLVRNFRYVSSQPQSDPHSEFPLIDISQVVLDSVELVEKDLELSQIGIKVAAEAMTFAHMDAGVYQNAVLNLLSNAKNNIVKEGRIVLSLKKTDATIELRCQDNGKDPKENLSPLTTINSMSLSFCQTLIESFQGKLTRFYSAEDGNVTQITLPACTTPAELFPEQRRFRRVKVTLPMAFQLAKDQTWVRTELDTLSFGGCFVLMGDKKNAFPEFNDTLSIRIHHFGEEVIEIPKARIASVFVSGEKAGMGIEFLELSAHHQKLLEAILKGHTG